MLDAVLREGAQFEPLRTKQLPADAPGQVREYLDIAEKEGARPVAGGAKAAIFKWAVDVGLAVVRRARSTSAGSMRARRVK